MLRLLKFLPDCLRNNLHKIPCAPALGKLHNVPQWNDWYLTLALRRWFSDSDLQAAGLPALRWPESPPSRITQQWGRISYAELFAYTEPMLLRDSDVMSMASSLELRVPFLDHRIVELALRMPQRFQRCGKYLLRDAFSDLFPVDYLHQPKRGFGLPMSLWMRGPLRGLCIVRLDRLKDSRLLTPTWVDSQWQSFLSGHLHWTRIWSLIVLGEYYLRGVH
jgi:asparagine synthase (glutamine-hydrolysing)